MSSLTETAKNMGFAKIGTIAAAAAVMIAFFIMITFRVSTGSMSLLYTDLSMQDSTKIAAELEKSGIPYELRANGTAIAVPSDKMLNTRMSMAQQGLPSGGSMIGYEIFDRTDTFGSSNFVMNINMLRALEGELARTIASMARVESARVHVVMPKQELFTRDKAKPSAAVTLKLRGSNTLESGEVAAITHLVAASVPMLETNRVTVVDSNGRLLARGDGDSMSAGASVAEEYRRAYEKRVQTSLETLIEKVIGPGKVQVHVAADINLDRTTINSEKFDPDGQVARSTQSNSEKENSQEKSPKDPVTVANNLPALPGSGEDGKASSTHTIERKDETTNFEISKTVQSQIREGGTIDKLSVAVLVDGVRSIDEEGKSTYTPRTEEELKQLRTLVASAIGYDEKRGDQLEVVNMPFSQDGLAVGEESFVDRFKIELQSIMQTLIIAAVAILAILMVLRPAVVHLIKHTTPPSGRVGDELAALEGQPGMAALPLSGASGGGGMAPMGAVPAEEESETDKLIDVANIKGGMKSSTMRKINEVVDKYPEESMNVLRQWTSSNK